MCPRQMLAISCGTQIPDGGMNQICDKACQIIFARRPLCRSARDLRSLWTGSGNAEMRTLDDPRRPKDEPRLSLIYAASLRRQPWHASWSGLSMHCWYHLSRSAVNSNVHQTLAHADRRQEQIYVRIGSKGGRGHPSRANAESSLDGLGHSAFGDQKSIRGCVVLSMF